MARRFLRSVIHARNPAPAALAALAISGIVTASGHSLSLLPGTSLPRKSNTSASSEASGAWCVPTIAQKASVFGGGAFGSNKDRSNVRRYAATWSSPPDRYQRHSAFQEASGKSSLSSSDQ